MSLDPVNIDINLRQNVDKEADKATKGINEMAEASDEASKRSREALQMQRDVIARLKKELEPLQAQFDKVNVGTHDPKMIAERQRLSQAVQELRAELRGEEEALKELEKASGTVAEKQTTLLTQMRNVKNEMAQMKIEGKGETEMYREKEEQLRILATAHSELTREQKLLASGGSNLQGFLSGLSALSGLLSAGGGALGLLNANSKEYAAIQTKVQSLMAIAIGLQQVQNALHQTSAFRIQTVTKAKQLWTAATTRLTAALGISNLAAKALMGTLTLGLSVVIGAVIAGIDSYAAKQRAAREEQQKLADSVAQNAASQITSYEKLRISYNKLGNDIKSKEKFIRDNKDAFKKLGVSISDVNAADNLFVEGAEDFKSAVIERAKSVAIMEAATEKYKGVIEKMLKYESMPDKKAVYVQQGQFGGSLSHQIDNKEKAKLKQEIENDKKEFEALIEKSIGHTQAADALLNKNNIKPAVSKTDKSEENARKSALKKLSDLSYDIQKEIDATTVAAMREGRDKKLAELKADYDARVALIEKRRKEIAELEKTTGVDGSEQKALLDTLEEAETRKYDAKKRTVNEGAAAAIAAVQEEINARFRKANDQRLAEIDRFYKEQTKRAKENGATQAQLDEIDLQHTRDTALEKQHIALETLDFEAQIEIRRAGIADRRVMLQTDREEKILKIQLNAAQKRLAKLKEMETAGGDVVKDIQAVTAEIEAMNAELDRIPAQKMAELAGYAQQILDGLGGFASSFDDAFGGLFDMASGAVGGIASLGTGIASGKPQQIISGAMQLLDVVGKIIKANKRANEEIRKFNLSLAQQAIDYSLAVIRSIKDIKSETDSIFTSNYTNTLTQGMAGYNAAIEKQSELMRKLGAATIKTGVEKKKFLFITIGTRDVYSNLIKQYPDLIKKDGTLNREMAETLKRSGNLNEETARLIDNILNASDAAKEAVQAVESELQNLVGSLGQELKNALDDAFASGTDSARTMTGSVVKMLKELSTQNLFNAVFGGIFSQLEQRMKDSVGIDGDRDLTDDIGWFMEQYGRYVDDYNKGLSQLREAVEKQYRVDPFSVDEGRKSVNKGIAQASQDSIDELNGRLTFLVMKVSDISAAHASHADLGREQLLVLRAMLGSLETIAENSEFLRKLQRIDENIDRLTREGTYIKK